MEEKRATIPIPEGQRLPDKKVKISSLFLDSGAFGLYNLFSQHAVEVVRDHTLDSKICKFIEGRESTTSRDLYKHFKITKQNSFRTHLHRLTTLGLILRRGGNAYKWHVNKSWRDIKSGKIPFYKTKAFWRYVDNYCDFIKSCQQKWNVNYDFYANVDVLYKPGYSWKVLKYMEDKHGLKPVPVIHYGTPIKWLNRHLDAGYDMIGLGGIGKGTSLKAYMRWADKMFERVCPTNNDRMPIARIHGFAMTSHMLLMRYPWYSVDSSSWTKFASYGILYVPHFRNGSFNFQERPYSTFCSLESPRNKHVGKHIDTLAKKERDVILRWLEHINVPLGDKDNWGIRSSSYARTSANLKFFEAACASLPPWPRPFKCHIQETFMEEEELA